MMHRTPPALPLSLSLSLPLPLSLSLSLSREPAACGDAEGAGRLRVHGAPRHGAERGRVQLPGERVREVRGVGGRLAAPQRDAREARARSSFFAVWAILWVGDVGGVVGPCVQTSPRTKRQLPAESTIAYTDGARTLEPNVVTCNALISACEKGRQWQGALWVLARMQGTLHRL